MAKNVQHAKERYWHKLTLSFSGDGFVSSDREGKKVLARGTFEGGELQKGIIYGGKDDFLKVKKRAGDRVYGRYFSKENEKEQLDCVGWFTIRFDKGYRISLKEGHQRRGEKWSWGQFERGILEGEGKITKDEKGKILISEGIFNNGRLVKGKSRYSTGYWHWGQFDKYVLQGEGKITEDEEGKVIYKEGIFDDGKLIKGKWHYRKHWYWEEFKNDGLLQGYGKITSDEEGKDILEEGQFEDEHLAFGHKNQIKNGKEYRLCGSFKRNKLHGTGKITCDGEITHNGHFENNYLVNGIIKFSKDNWYCGELKNNMMHGKGRRTYDAEGLRLVSEGTFEDNYLVQGKEYNETIDRWICGSFKDRKLHGKGKISRDEEGKDVTMEGEFLHNILVNGTCKGGSKFEGRGLFGDWFWVREEGGKCTLYNKGVSKSTYPADAVCTVTQRNERFHRLKIRDTDGDDTFLFTDGQLYLKYRHVERIRPLSWDDFILLIIFDVAECRFNTLSRVVRDLIMVQSSPDETNGIDVEEVATALRPLLPILENVPKLEPDMENIKKWWGIK